MKKFTTGFFAVLLMLCTAVSGVQAQSNSTIIFKDVTDLSRLNLNICDNTDTVTLYIGNKTGTNPITNISVPAVFGQGLHYVAGATFITDSLNGTTPSAGYSVTTSGSIFATTFSITGPAGGGQPNGVSRYLKFLVKADCSVFDAIGNPIYNDYKLNFKIGATSYTNSDVSQQAYNNAFKIPNLPLPTWQYGQSLSFQSGTTTCRQYWIQNTSATNGFVRNLRLYDINTPGFQVVSIGIAKTSGGAPVNIPTYIVGDTTFADVTPAHFIAAGFGDSLGPNQRVYVTECVNAYGLCSPQTFNSTIGFRWGFCEFAPCQDEINTATANVTVAAPSVSSGLDGSTVATKCYGSLTDDQVVYFTNSGGATAQSLTFTLNVGTSSYTTFVSGSFQIDTGTGYKPFTPTLTVFNSDTAITNCFGSTVYKTVSGTLPVKNLAAGQTIRVKFKTKNCCPSGGCGRYVFNEWSGTGSFTSACSAGSPTGFTINGVGQSVVDLAGKYSGTFNYAASSSYTIPWTISNTEYTNWGADANGQWVFTTTLSNFFTFANNPGDVYIKNASGSITYNPSSVTVSGNTIIAKFDMPLPGGFSFKNAKFYVKTNTVACTPAACSSIVYDYIDWSAAYVPDRTCASPCAIPVECLHSKVRIAKYCGGGPVCACPITNFYFNRISRGLPDNNNDGLPDGATIDSANALLTRGMYLDTMRAVIDATSTGNGLQYLYTSMEVENANQLQYLGGTVTIRDVSAGTTYSCQLPAPTTSVVGTTVTYQWQISAGTVSGCAPAIPGAYKFDLNDVVVLRPLWRISNNINWATELQGNVTPGAVFSNNATSSGLSFSDCGYFGQYSITGYAVDQWTHTGTVYTGTCGTGTIGSYFAFYNFQGHAGENAYPYEYRDWMHIATTSMKVPAGYQYIPGTAAIHYSRTNGDDSYVTINQALTPVKSVSGTDTLFTFNLASAFTGTGGALPYSDDGWVMYIDMQVKALGCATADNYSQYWWQYDLAPAANQHIIPGAPYYYIPYSYYNYLYHTSPSLSINPTAQTILGTAHSVQWQMTIQGNNGQTSPNTWFSLSSADTNKIKVINVYDITGAPTLVPKDANGLYRINNLVNGTGKVFAINAYYNSCATEALSVTAGWNCSGYPVGVSGYAPCTPVTNTLYVSPVPAKIQTNVVEQPSARVELCDTFTYGVQLASVDYGRTYNNFIDVFVPLTGVFPIPGTWQVKFPTTGTYTTIANPVLSAITPLGKRYTLNIQSLVPYISANGLDNGFDPDSNSVFIHFDARTDCGYLSGSRVLFRGRAQDLCGQNLRPALNSTNKIKIKTIGADPLQSFAVRVVPGSFIPCNDSSTKVTEVIYNTGPFATDSFTKLVVDLNPGLKYVGGTAINLSEPHIDTIGGGVVRLTFTVPAGLTVNDSMVVYYNLKAVDSGYNYQFHFVTRILNEIKAVCISNGDTCDLSEITGEFEQDLTVGTPKLSISNIVAHSECNAPTGENVFIDFDITNANVATNYNLPINANIWWDANNNNKIDGPDIKVGTYQILGSIDSGTTRHISTIYSVPAAQSCKLILSIDSLTSACLPLRIDTPLGNIKLENAGDSIFACNNATSKLGCQSGTSGAIFGYTYSWSAIGGAPLGALSCTNCANPTYTFPANNTGANLVYKYILTTNRGIAACQNKDTVVVTVYPSTTVVINSADTNLCSGQCTNLQAVGSPAGGTYVWNPVNFMTPSTGDQALETVCPPATQSYGVTYSKNGCSSNAYKTVNVVTPVLAEAGSNQSYCLPVSTTITIGGSPTASGGSGNYSYNWSPTTNLSNATVANPTVTAVAMNTVYYVTVTDNVSGCVSVDSARITINPQASVSIASVDTDICVGQFATLTATGLPAGGSYSWNPTIGMTPASGNTAAVDVAPGSNQCYQVTYTAAGCSATAIKCVRIFGTPLAEGGPDKALCPNVPSVQIGQNATGGSGSYSYAWSPSATLSNATIAQPVASPVATTTYYVTVTDLVSGCTGIDSVKVTRNPAPAADAGPNASVCVGNSVQLNATGAGVGGTYQWAANATLSSTTFCCPTATPTATTTYTVTVTDINGCTASDTVQISVNPGLTVSAPDVEICEGQSAVLVPNLLGAQYKYQWTPGIGISCLTCAQPTIGPTTINNIYSVKITDTTTGCSGTDTVNVTVHQKPRADFFGQQLCQGDTVQFTDHSSSVDPIASWFYDFGDSTFTNDTSHLQNPRYVYRTFNAHDASLTVTTIYGCVDSFHLPVYSLPPVTPFAGMDTAIGFGGSTILGATGGTSYSWSPTSSLTNANTANPTASPAVTTTYTVTVTNDYGCKGVDSVIVYVLSLPNVSAGPDTFICVGNSIKLNGSSSTPGVTYRWIPTTYLSNPNIAQPTATPLFAGTYEYVLKVTGQYGIVNYDTMVLTVYPKPVLSASADSLSFCGGGNAVVNFNSNVLGTTFAWTGSNGTSGTGNINQMLTNSGVVDSITNFTIVGTAPGGCQDTLRVRVRVKPNPVITANGFPAEICSGTNYSGSISSTVAGTSVSWTASNGLNGTGSTINQLINNPGTTPLSVVFTFIGNANGCLDTATTTVTVNPLPQADAGPDKTLISCTSDSLQLGGSPSAKFGTPGYTYSWTPTAGLTSTSVANPYVKNLGAFTTYTLSVTDSKGCTASDQVNVSVTGPTLSVNITISNGSSSFCEGSGASVDLNAVVTGGTPGYTYQWTPTAFLDDSVSPTVTANPNVAGSYPYTLIVTDSKGCQASKSRTITVKSLPHPVITGLDTIFCAGIVSVPLTASIPGGTFSGPGVVGNTFRPKQIGPGSYTITYTVTVNGCTHDTFQNVTVSPNPTIIISGYNPSYCSNDGAVTLHGSPLGGTWSGPGIDSLTGLFTPGSVSVPNGVSRTISIVYHFPNPGYCSDSGSVSIVINKSPSITISASVDTICVGQAVTLTPSVSSPPSYGIKWYDVNGSLITNSINPIVVHPTRADHGYYAVITTPANCSNDDTVFVHVNQRPVANDDVDSTCEGTPRITDVLVNDTDPEGNSNVVRVLSAHHGAAVLNANKIQFTPAYGYFGNDTITYEICNVQCPNECDTAALYMSICPQNEPPVADSIHVYTVMNTPIGVNVGSATSDPNGDPMTYTYGSPSVAGTTVTVTGNGTISVNPPTGFVGNIAIPYTVCDTSIYPVHVLCASSVIVVHVTNPGDTLINHAPIANTDRATAVNNTPINVNVRANDFDPDHDALTLPQIVSVSGGTASVNPDGTIRFVPQPLPLGIWYDTVKYRVCDTLAAHNPKPLCSTALLIVTINNVDTTPKNRPPFATDDYQTVPENTTVNIVVKGNDSDPDGDSLGTPTIVTPPTHGVAVNGPNGTISYTPDQYYHGTDSFSYQVCDTLASLNPKPLCDIAWVHIIVDPRNEAPQADTIRYTDYQNKPHDVNILLAVTDPNGDPLTITVGTPSDPSITYVVTGNGAITVTGTTPGTYTIPYYVCDLSPYQIHSLCDTGVIIATILPTVDTLVNHAPVASNDYATTNSTTSAVTVNVRGNDYDPDGDSLTVPVLSGPAILHYPGSFSVDANGNVVFTPSASALPQGIYKDSVPYQICDITTKNPHPLCSTAWVVVTINTIDTVSNRPPVAVDDHVSTPENTPITINVRSNDSDPDGDSLTKPTIVTPPTHGTVSVGPNGDVTYTPDPFYHGSDSFQYSVCDTLSANNPQHLCDQAWVHIIVDPRNEAPQADTIRYTDYQNKPHDVNILLAVTDPNGDPLTITVGTPSDPSITYVVTGNGAITVTGTTPGTYTIPYYVCDLSPYQIHSLCDTGVIIATILPTVDTLVNHAPVASNDYATTNSTTSAVTVNVRGNDYDPDGDSLTVPVLSGPAILHYPGSFSVDANGNVVFTPSASALPQGIYKDSVPYQICDITTKNPHPLCSTAWVVVTINTIDTVSNRPPVAVDDHVSTPENTPITINVRSNDSDPDGDSLTKPTIVTPPTHGTVSVGPNGDVTYTPDPFYHGSDSFQYSVCDTLSANNPQHLCDQAWVHIIVDPRNEAPQADTIRYTDYQNKPHDVNILLAVTDPNGDPLTITVGTPSDPSITYVVTGNGAITVTGTTPGTYTIPYYVCDLSPYQIHSLCDTGVIIATILPTVDTLVNHAPVASNDYATTNSTTSAVTVNVRGNDYDPDGDSLTVPVLSGPAILHYPGSFSVDANGNVVFTPSASALPQGIYKDSVPYQICDITTKNPHPLCSTAWVVVTINTIDTVSNRPPVAVDDHVSTPENTPITINVRSNDSDPDGDSLTKPTIVTPPTHGTVSVGPNGDVTYTPDPFYHGSDSFQYSVCDTLSANNPQHLCDQAWVHIIVDPRNEAPQADTIRYTDYQNKPHDVNILLAVTDPNGDPLTITVGTPSDPSITYVVTGNGAITVTGTTPGTYTIPYYVCDLSPYQIHSLCDTGVIIATILPTVDTLVNHAPVASNDYATTNSTTSAVTVNVRGNDYDPDGDSLTVPVLITSTTTPHGAYTVDASGNVVFTPSPASLTVPGIYHDSVQYQICDITTKNPHPLCSTAWVVVTINNIDTTQQNRPPVAVDDHVTTDEDVTLVINVRVNDSDPDGDSLTIPVIVTGPVNGTASVDPVTGNVTYVPNPDFHGVDSFYYSICDTLSANNPQHLCDQAWVYITINGINEPPVATNIYVNTMENQPVGVNVASGATDPNGDPLTFSYPSGSGPLNGTWVPNPSNPTNGSGVYTPNPGFIGVDSFEYVVCDNSPYPVHVLCDTAWVVIHVNDPGDSLVNHPPVASTDHGVTAPGETIVINVKANDSDPDGNPLTVPTIVTTPSQGGTVTVNTDGTVSYHAPATIPVGILNDTFTYSVCDITTVNPQPLCATAMVIVTINKVDTPDVHKNDPPVAVDDYATICEEEYAVVNVVNNDIDPNGDPVKVTAVLNQPAHGLAAASGPNVVYVPSVNFYGSDSASYILCDNRTPALCDTAWVHFTVRNVNDQPLAANDTAYTGMNTAVNVPVLINDIEPDGDSVYLGIVTPPIHGTAVLNANNTFTYTPAAGYAGYDTFYYKVCDVQNPNIVYCGTFQSICDVGLVSILIANRPPHVDSTFVTIPEDTGVVRICPNITDPDGNSVKITALSCQPAHGVATIGAAGSDSCLTYKPNLNYYGLDSFCVVVCDNGIPSLCDTNQVYITVTPVCDPPVAKDDNYVVSNTNPSTLTVTANDSSVEGPITVSVITQGTLGIAVPGANNTIVYTPTAGAGSDSFTYAICNVGPLCTLCDTGMVHITIRPVNHPPVAVDDSTSTPQNQPVCVDVKANDSDQDGDILSVTAVSCQPAHGTASINGANQVCYQPAQNFVGNDVLCYVVCDNAVPALCDTAKVFITVTSNPHPPVAVNDTATIPVNTPAVICVTNNDTDPDNNINKGSVGLCSLPIHAASVPSINPATGCITYNPQPGFIGMDSFCYRVCDSTQPTPLCAQAMVYINVTPVNHPPFAPDTTVTTPEDSAITVCPAMTDPDGNVVAISSVCTPAHGTVTFTGSCMTYTPASNYNGTDQFCYVACDNGTPSLCDTGIVTINITPVTDCPDAVADYATGHQGLIVNINELSNDTYVHAVGSGSAVTVVGHTASANTVTVLPNGWLSYVAAPGFNGLDTVVYSLCDNVEGCCDTATVIVVTDTNCFGPKPAADHFTVCEESVLTADVLANDYPGNTGLGSVSIITNAQHGFGFVNSATNMIMYTPVTNFFGADSIVYQICDQCTKSAPNCDIAKLYINVLNRNDVPTAIDDTISTLEDHSVVVNVLSNDYDIDGDSLVVSISAQPAFGTLTLDSNRLVYTPKSNFCGVDTFGYKITGGNGNASCPGDENFDLGLVVVTVICVNDTPIIPDTLIHTPEDTPVTVCIPYIDVDTNDTHTLSVCGSPLHGSMAYTITDDPNLVCVTYTPDSNYYGTDSICIIVCDVTTTDPHPLCDTTHITIIVDPRNEPPVAHDVYVQTPKDQPTGISIYPAAFDPNGDPLTFSYPGSPSHGIWTPTGNGTGVYTPTPGYVGTDSFVYIVCDNSPILYSPLCDTAVVYINVVDTTGGVNHPPVANNDYATTTIDKPVVVNAAANDFDVDGDTLAFTPISATTTSHGTFSMNPVTGVTSYVPNTGYVGVDTLQYMVCDNGTPSLCDTATIFIVITPDTTGLINNPPVATDDFAHTQYGVSVNIPVMSNDWDPDGDSIHVTSVSAAPHYGTTVVNPDGTITYVPDFGPGLGPNAHRPDTFKYIICDNGNPVLCDEATVIITVPNSVQAINDTTLTGKNVPVVVHVLSNDFDPELDSFYVTAIVDSAKHGTVTLNADGSVLYTPDGTVCDATDSFRYAIMDTLGATDTAWAFVNVICCQVVANDDNLDMNQGDTLYAHVTINDNLDNRYPHHVKIQTNPAHGVATVINDTTIMYIPASNYCGKDYIEYTVSDTCGLDTGNVNITIFCDSVKTIAVDDYAFTNRDSCVTIDILDNDIYANCTPAVVTILDSTNHGTVQLDSANHVKYCPNAGYVGMDTFTYSLCETCGSTSCDTAIGVILIDTVCRNPIAVNDTSNHGYVCNDTVNVIKNDINTFGATISIIQPPANGSAVVSGGSIIYTPDGLHPNSTVTIGYRICGICIDAPCSDGILTINMTGYPCNVHHPEIVSDYVSVCRNSDSLICVTANDYDVDGDAISLTAIVPPTHGTAVKQGNCILYHPDANYSGGDTMAYMACDNGVPNLCNTARVYISVIDCKNTPPVAPPPVDTTVVCTPVLVCLDSVYDAEGDSVFISSVCTPNHGTISNINGTCFTYSPSCDTTNGQTPFVGVDTFCIVICDNGTPVPACDTIYGKVVVLPKAPIDSIWANNDNVATAGGTPVVINVLGNDGFTPNPGNPQTGTGITVDPVLPSQPQHGTAVVNANGTITYTPEDTFCGVDSFRYAISDNGHPVQHDTATVYVFVCIQPVHAVNDSMCNDTTTYVNVAVDLNVLANDTLPMGDDTTVTVGPAQAAHGNTSVNNDLTIHYVPAEGFIGDDHFEYIVCVTLGNETRCDTAEVCVQVVDTTKTCTFPNAFSPNGDGIHDYFETPCTEMHPKATLRVFNRWGDEVWTSKEAYKNDWGGTNNQGTALPDGTYYFVYTYNDGTGGSEARFVVIHR
ncbi:MAG: Ig-like domain-containing protein [Chitinophagales bacterium]